MTPFYDGRDYGDLSVRPNTMQPTSSQSLTYTSPLVSDELIEEHSIPSTTQHVYSHVRSSSSSSFPDQDENCEAAEDMPDPRRSKIACCVIIFALCGINVVSTMSTGAFTISLPRIAKDVRLAPNFLLWPATIYSLTGGCTILLMGTIADHIGNRVINILGCWVIGIFILASGFSQTGAQLIAFRGCQGVGMSMAYPTAFSILSNLFGPGSWRNYSFACLGLSQPLGWSLGLILGGVGEGNSLGWRFAFYLSGAMSISLGFVNYFMLPADRARDPFQWDRFWRSIDWIGLAISSTCIGLLCYVFATYANDVEEEAKKPINIALVIVGGFLIPAFWYWMRRQERRERPALIPNSIWKNNAFSSICIVVILAWGALQCIELFLSLYFQEVQMVNVLDAALRFLPNVVVGCIVNVITGHLVSRMRADCLVSAGNFMCAMAPLIIALAESSTGYWKQVFWGVALSPISADIVFTVANLIIADVFPDETQGLAGAVFNTVSQFGSAIGLAVAAIISGNVTRISLEEGRDPILALNDGYRAVFWMCLAAGLLAAAISFAGLYGIGRVGKKQEVRDGEPVVNEKKQVRISQVPLTGDMQ